MPLLQDLYEELLKQPEPEAKRVVCVVLKGLGENHRKIAMHVTNKFVTSAVNTNYQNGAGGYNS